MRLFMFGINHRTADLALREAVGKLAEDAATLCRELKQTFPSGEWIVLSTCNRFECYLARPVHQPPTSEDWQQWLSDRAGVEASNLASAMIRREQGEAVAHLFRVAGGIESMVVGEPQILGQVRRAYQSAIDADAVGPMLHKIFQDALAAGKKVRSETTLANGRVSVGSVAVDFARQVFDHFDDKSVLCIGAGEIAKAALARLKETSPRHLWITNRTATRANELADSLGLTSPDHGSRPYDELDSLLAEADVVITSTASPEPIITPQRMKPILRKRRYRPFFMLDLAVPRDIEEKVASLANVYVHNIDDLQQVIEQTFAGREGELDRCRSLLREQAERSFNELLHRDVGQLIRKLRDTLHELGQSENERTHSKLAANPQRANELIDEHTHRLINKILHLPISRLNDAENDTPLGFYAAAIRKLFGLDEMHSAEDASLKETESSDLSDDSQDDDDQPSQQRSIA